MGIGDAPVAGFQLHRLGAFIGDVDRVGPEEIIVLRRRAIGDETRRHHDFNIAGHGAIHASDTAMLQLIPATRCEAHRRSSEFHLSSRYRPQKRAIRRRDCIAVAKRFLKRYLPTRLENQRPCRPRPGAPLNGATKRHGATIVKAAVKHLVLPKLALKSVTAAASPLPPGGRDLRLDLFRGIALWLIFLDHIPQNVVNWFTIRNYGFSDATEIFIFISGYTAAFVYGRAMRERGLVVSGARILRRAWQIYVAHIFLFAIYMAEISYVATSFDNPLYAEEMNILDFLKQPDMTIVQALLLKFKPVNMDILPLYIVLLLLFPPVLWLLQRWPMTALGGSLTLYVLVWQFDWNLPAYPDGTWYFNPFAWQLLFVFGAWCALGGAQRLSAALRSRVVLAIAITYLVF